MKDILMSPYCMSRGSSICGAPAPCGMGMVSILFVSIVHPIAVTLCDSSSQKVTVSSEFTSQSIKSGLMPCSQILSSIDEQICVGEFEGETVVVVEFLARLVGTALGKHPRLPEAGPVKCQSVRVLAAAKAAWHWQWPGQGFQTAAP